MNWLNLIELIAGNNADGLRFRLKDWLEQNGLYPGLINGWWPLRKNPSWDIEVRECLIEEETGLLLIERRDPGGSCDATDAESLQQISDALNEANDFFSTSIGGTWQLSPDGHYRLSNRVSWALQLARSGIPVVLYFRGYQVGYHEEVIANEWWGRWIPVTISREAQTRLLLLPREYEALPAVIEARGH